MYLDVLGLRRKERLKYKTMGDSKYSLLVKDSGRTCGVHKRMSLGNVDETEYEPRKGLRRTVE